MATYHHVERITRQGTCLYLMHVPDLGLEWTTNEDEALRYHDLEEAEEDAAAHGGEVTSFESGFGHNAAARLERRYANLIAAE